jgi:hypothetical protein
LEGDERVQKKVRRLWQMIELRSVITLLTLKLRMDQWALLGLPEATKPGHSYNMVTTNNREKVTG